MANIGKVSVELSILYPDQRMADAVLEAINPDNFQVPEGLEIISNRCDSEVNIKVTCNKSVGTLTSSLDDLLSCISAAEKTLACLR